jgi:PPK2 family polyphosphate:nucleotide phosphotransferase
MDYYRRFKVRPGTKVRLDKVDADYKGKHESSATAQPEIDKHCQRLRELQYRLYAEGKRSLLVCLQAMDAGGKDGTVNHVLSAMNPQGCSVHGFKQPHDFLWRIHKACPRKGQVTIFNRSHYEDVLVVRVHGLVPKKVWTRRYEQINAFERLLAENDSHVLKIYLHISKEEQLERFKQRIDDPARHWKISEGDYAERPYWNDYQKAFEAALSRCSTTHAPWFVVPANHKWFRNLAVSQIMVKALERMHAEFPEPTVDMAEIKKKYHAAKDAAQARRK